jgi:hypothetical protein
MQYIDYLVLISVKSDNGQLIIAHICDGSAFLYDQLTMLDHKRPRCFVTIQSVASHLPLLDAYMSVLQR